MTTPEHSVLVSVLGPTSHGPIFHSSMEGVGKSCLCCRFIHPGVDEYVAEHPSLLALHEFESHVVSAEPFLYWGKRTMEFGHRGTAGPSLRVHVEVVEHTIFYHDETSRPFPSLLKLLPPEDFTKNAARTPESSRKVSYYSRDLIGFPDNYRCCNFPTTSHRFPRAFVLVVDVSRSQSNFSTQLSTLERMIGKLKKSMIVLAATKRDIVNTDSLRRLCDWADKMKLPMLETSAKDDINVADVFRVAAAKGLHKKIKGIPESITSYADASGRVLACKVRERNQFANYLAKRVKASEASLSLVDSCEEYRMATAHLGKFAVDEVFAMHLLKIRNDEVSNYAGVKDDADMRLEFLEDFIEGMENDLVVHASALRR